MWRSYYIVIVIGVQLFSGPLVTAIPVASVALAKNQGQMGLIRQGNRQSLIDPEHQRHINPVTISLPNSFALITVPEDGLFPNFGNGTSLLRGQMQRRFHRVKRQVCKSRPETEIMEYFGLKLPGRCWEDCDCRIGRYCTSHSWCHDINAKQ